MTFFNKIKKYKKDYDDIKEKQFKKSMEKQKKISGKLKQENDLLKLKVKNKKLKEKLNNNKSSSFGINTDFDFGLGEFGKKK